MMKQMTNVDNSGSSVSKFRYMMLTVLLALMGMVTISCSSDDDEPLPEKNDYYIEYKFSGGGLSEQELAELSAINNTGEVFWAGYSVTDAIYEFNKGIKNIEKEFAGGYSGITKGTMVITITLKTTEGRIVKTEVIRVTRSGLA